MSSPAVEAIVQAGAIGLLALTIILGFRYLQAKNGEAVNRLNQVHEDLRAIVNGQEERRIEGMEQHTMLAAGQAALQVGQAAIVEALKELVLEGRRIR